VACEHSCESWRTGLHRSRAYSCLTRPARWRERTPTPPGGANRQCCLAILPVADHLHVVTGVAVEAFPIERCVIAVPGDARPPRLYLPSHSKIGGGEPVSSRRGHPARHGTGLASA
jgi:hypothetical protein